jgi:hypothetical protein
MSFGGPWACSQGPAKRRDDRFAALIRQEGHRSTLPAGSRDRIRQELHAERAVQMTHSQQSDRRQCMLAERLGLVCVVFLAGCSPVLRPSPTACGYLEVQLSAVTEDRALDQVLLDVHLVPHDIAPGVRISALSLGTDLTEDLRFRDERGERLLLLNPGGWSESHPGPFPSYMVAADRPTDLVVAGHVERQMWYLELGKEGTQPASGVRLRYYVYTIVLGDNGKSKDMREVDMDIPVRGSGWTEYVREGG